LAYLTELTIHVNLDEAMKEDPDQDADLVRISGKSRSEFPEPTVVSAWVEARASSVFAVTSSLMFKRRPS
jgi:hypothetical protein